MKKIYWLALLLSVIGLQSYAQEIQFTEAGALEQVYGETTESENLLPFNDLNIEFGYALYLTEIETESENTVLELENVRDYTVVYLNDKLQGTLTDNDKKLTLDVPPGKYTLRLYAENIGRITYGPEILDNSKGLFGSITLDGEEIENWTIIPLTVKEYDINELQFSEHATPLLPSFHKGYFEIETPKDTYLDISGWGMGEVWINGNYMGSYWEMEKQQSIQVPADNQRSGKNDIIVFELKNNNRKAMRFADNPVFK